MACFKWTCLPVFTNEKPALFDCIHRQWFGASNERLTLYKSLRDVYVCVNRAFSKFPYVEGYDVDSFDLHNCVEVQEDRRILHTKIRKDNWIGHILLRNRFLEHVIVVNIEGIIEVTGRRGRRRKSYWMTSETWGYWKLKEEALDRAMWSTGFARDHGHVLRLTTEWMNEWRFEETV